MLNLEKLVLSTLLLLATAATAVAAPIKVTYSTFPSGSLTSYNFFVTNGLDASAGELLSVTLSVPADPAAVQNLTAPGGFNAFFDPGLGLVDFVENSMGFTAGSTVGPFSFLSPFQITPSFTGLVLDPTQNPVIVSVDVVAAAAVPEPGSTVLAVLGLFTLAASRRMFSRKQPA